MLFLRYHETVVSAFRLPHTQFHESLRLQFPFVFRRLQSLQLLLPAHPCLPLSPPAFSGPSVPHPIGASLPLSDLRCFRSLSVASVLDSDYSASALPFPFFLIPPRSGFLSAPSSLSLLRLPPFSPAWFPVRSFPVPVLSDTVRFLSLFPASLPQPFRRCLPSFPVPRVPFFSGSSRPLLFRFLASPSFPVFSASRPLPFVRIRSASSYSAFCSSFQLFPLPPHSGFPGAQFRSRFPVLLRSLRLIAQASFPDSLTRLFCPFPFVLPCFAPAAVPQVIPFQISPPGSVPDFRFLPFPSVRFRFSISLLSLCFFLSVIPASASQWLPQFPIPLSLPRFPPSVPPGFPCATSGFPYSASCSFPFALP